ncbi:MAG: hypothetical protein L0216_19250 [Planctomycetales bacterium]|nr:hypothetical protein [Planctomycetales bacterium]
MIHDRVMFEIYRDTAYTGRYRVVCYTELHEGNRDPEIARASAGEHVYDGFYRTWKADEAKAGIEGVVRRLNDGEALSEEEIRSLLAPYDVVAARPA